MLQAHKVAFAVLAMVCGLSEPALAADAIPPKPVSPEAAAIAAAPADPEPQTMTIFGRRKPGTYPWWARGATVTGGGCGFISDADYETFFRNLGPEARDKHSVLEKAPFGSARDDTESLMLKAPGGSAFIGGCGSGGFAAGRAAIARRDTSLRDAYAAFDSKDYPAALELFRKSYVKMGYNDAALMLGKMYLAGLGTAQNTPEAIKWLTKVTEIRFNPSYSIQRFDEKDPAYMSVPSDAAMLLGRIYMTGWGTARDPVKARKWHMTADKFGFIPGTYLVGRMFDTGYGGDKSVVRAAKYYRKSGEVGYAPAQFELGVLLLEGDDGVAAKPKEGTQWILEAAKRGHPEALFAAGRMYDLGQVVAADAQKAIFYYKEAALKGNAQAQTALGTYFYTGEIVGRDLAMARRWFFYAAENGDPQALLKLGAMLEAGEGGDKDLAFAYALFRLAGRAGLDAGAKKAAALEPKLTAEDKARAEGILNPPAA